MLTLRPYQLEAKHAVYDHLRTRDDNPCVVIPTAGGKTPVMASVCQDAVTLWNGRVIILAHVKELLEQTADKLNTVCPEVRYGVYSAGLKRRDTDRPVTVAGIQSVYPIPPGQRSWACLHPSMERDNGRDSGDVNPCGDWRKTRR
jgi:DNA repair protein RadD